MKKIILSGTAIAAMLMLLAGCHEEKQEQKPTPQFGVVQINKLYKDSRIGKAGFERLSGLESKAQGILKEAVAALEKGRAGDKDVDVSRIERELQERVAFMQEVIRQDQEHVSNVLQTVMKNVLDKYSKDHGLFGVFSAENMLSASPEADVTDQIMTLLDQVEPAFGDVPSLELPKLPEPANALPVAEEAAPATAPAAEKQ